MRNALGWLLRRCHRRPVPAPKRCGHNDVLCDRYGCPDDSSWTGDGCA